jgi:PAS domain-containing protein
LKKLTRMLARTAQDLEAIAHPRVSVAWQDLNLVYRRVYNPSPDISTNILGKRLEDVIDDKAKAEQLNSVKREVIRSRRPYHETVKVGFGGRPHYYDLTVEPTYNEQGVMDGLISVNIDVTDLMEAKQHLAEANERLLSLLENTLDQQPGVRR